MMRLDNDVARIDYYEGIQLSISKVCHIIRHNPHVLRPVKDFDENVKTILSSEGFKLYPTVKNTTLFYDVLTDCFFKIIHPLKLKKRIISLFIDKSRTVYDLSGELISKGIKIPEVAAYGIIKNGRRPLLVTKKVEGVRLFDTLVREKKKITMAEYKKVIDEVIKFHSHGYWLGDAHLAHIFVKDGEVAGFIDIDSIRKNKPYRLKNVIKDIAGLNHPELPLSEKEKAYLLNYYLERSGIDDHKKFSTLLKYYTERRWGDQDYCRDCKTAF